MGPAARACGLFGDLRGSRLADGQVTWRWEGIVAPVAPRRPTFGATGRPPFTRPLPRQLQIGACRA
jgi:hypothetical protein